ncbi:hypothetical protein ACLOJK_006864, partial [Asimina triloba]
FNRSEHRPVKAEAAGSSPVSPGLESDESINSSFHFPFSVKGRDKKQNLILS